MSKPVADDLKERKRINATLESFLCLPSWTPAMGAMLVSGLTPTANCASIPEIASPLQHLGSEAKHWQIPEARRVLDRWTDSAEDDVENGWIAVVPSTVEPIAFLTWCQDEYDGRPDAMKPCWLQYWLAYAGFNHNANVPLPAPAGLVQYAAELDDTARTMGQMVADAKASATSLNNVDDYVTRMARSIRASRSPIADLIICALQKSANPRNPKSVRAQLVAIVKEQKPADMRHEEDEKEGDKLLIPHGEDAWRTYTIAALTRFLARHRKLFEGNAPS